MNYFLNADLFCLPLASQIIAATMAWNSDPCLLISARSLCSALAPLPCTTIWKVCPHRSLG